MKEYFGYLESIGIIDGPSANEVISTKDPFEALEILAECFTKVNGKQTDYPPRENSNDVFDFSASSSSSGGVDPCSGIQCRLNEAYRLCVFTALYGDKVTIPNFFDYFYDYIQSDEFPFRNDFEINNFYNRLIGDVAVYFEYKPLIEAGLVVVNRTLRAICSNCQKALMVEDKKFGKEVEKIALAIEKDITKHVKFFLHPDHYIEFVDKTNFLTMEGLEVNKLRGVKEARTKRQLHQGEIKRLGLDFFITTQSINDILIQNYYEELRDKTYLTNRPIDVQIIEASNSLSKNVSPLAPKDLEHILPLVSEVEVEKLLEVRKTEEPAFKRYRDSFQTIVDEAKKDPSFSAKNAINSEVKTAVHEIEQVIDSSKKFFREKAKKEIIFGSSLVTAGLLASHFLALELGSQAVKAGGAATASGAKKLIDAKVVPLEARNNKFYFLWKVARAHQH